MKIMKKIWVLHLPVLEIPPMGLMSALEQSYLVM
jgi:hypothetical protein